jgi:hypothetical protein
MQRKHTYIVTSIIHEIIFTAAAIIYIILHNPTVISHNMECAHAGYVQ